MAKRVLITGGSGLLGLNWAIACKDIYQVTLGLHTRQVELKGVDYCSPQIDTNLEMFGVSPILGPLIFLAGGNARNHPEATLL